MIPDENKVNNPMNGYGPSMDELENVSGGLTEEELKIQSAQKLTDAVTQIKGLNQQTQPSAADAMEQVLGQTSGQTLEQQMNNK